MDSNLKTLLDCLSFSSTFPQLSCHVVRPYCFPLFHLFFFFCLLGFGSTDRWNCPNCLWKRKMGKFCLIRSSKRTPFKHTVTICTEFVSRMKRSIGHSLKARRLFHRLESWISAEFSDSTSSGRTSDWTCFNKYFSGEVCYGWSLGSSCNRIVSIQKPGKNDY